jgi:hypothetical protein
MILGGVIAAHFASAQPFDMEVYRAIEPKLKASYEKQVGPFKQFYDAHLAEFKKTNTAGNWADHLEYDEWIKMMFHNQTNMAMSCAEDQKVSADEIKNEAAKL